MIPTASPYSHTPLYSLYKNIGVWRDTAKAGTRVCA